MKHFEGNEDPDAVMVVEGNEDSEVSEILAEIEEDMRSPLWKMRQDSGKTQDDEDWGKWVKLARHGCLIWADSIPRMWEYSDGLRHRSKHLEQEKINERRKQYIESSSNVQLKIKEDVYCTG